ncbi:hypothetical protein BD311DRAFT_221785 [Dichomitus squalens]|uniref:Uncharacterized protein n=1 Tax=Dichomitus squalens TaxID=114155 RepID=A0A4Q9M5N5_9APHY|nr:hypothetical protein BD311DRAFT_221785 [Dichomitus squalens]
MAADGERVEHLATYAVDLCDVFCTRRKHETRRYAFVRLPGVDICDGSEVGLLSDFVVRMACLRFTAVPHRRSIPFLLWAHAHAFRHPHGQQSGENARFQRHSSMSAPLSGPAIGSHGTRRSPVVTDEHRSASSSLNGIRFLLQAPWVLLRSVRGLPSDRLVWLNDVWHA